jgi:hypothetical protein
LVILIGGATRSGKSMVARRLSAGLTWPLLSLDVLKMGLVRAVPLLGVDPDSPPTEVGRVMWPLIRAMVENALDTDADYVFEGDMLSPDRVSELREASDGRLAACFLGYRRSTPEQKLVAIRRYRGLPNDWLNEHDDGYVLEEARLGIAESVRIARESERVGLRYFDGSAEFERMLDEAMEYLQALALAG